MTEPRSEKEQRKLDEIIANGRELATAWMEKIIGGSSSREKMAESILLCEVIACHMLATIGANLHLQDHQDPHDILERQCHILQAESDELINHIKSGKAEFEYIKPGKSEVGETH